MEKVNLNFGKEFCGELKTAKGSFGVGRCEKGLTPYEMLLASLGACFYATFISLAEKMKLDYEKVELEVSGEHRKEVPTTLETVNMTFTMYGIDEEKQDKYERASELAAKYCSIHETIAQVATINLHVRFA